MPVEGRTEPGFEPVREIFEQQFADGQHIGASVAVYHRGREVVSLWGGTADEEGAIPWAEDTMSIAWSTTKGITATCVHLCADRGLIDYEAPVARYWPEFAQNGKAEITVRMLLAHQAGMSVNPPGIDAADYTDWERVVSAIAAMPPAWEPGTASGYHALTFGFLAGELVRRVSGKSPGRAGRAGIGAFLRDEVCAPLGLPNMYIGAPASVEPRIAAMYNRFEITPEMMATYAASAGGAGAGASLMMRSLQPSSGDMGALLNSPAGHQAEIPAVSGVMNARDLARLYGCLANYGELDGVRFMREETVRAMTAPQSFRADLVVQAPVRWSLGFMNGAPGWPQGDRETAFGHPGFGGSLGFADPEIGLSFGLIVNALWMGLTGAGRATALADAARAGAAAS